MSEIYKAVCVKCQGSTPIEEHFGKRDPVKFHDEDERLWQRELVWCPNLRSPVSFGKSIPKKCLYQRAHGVCMVEGALFIADEESDVRSEAQTQRDDVD